MIGVVWAEPLEATAQGSAVDVQGDTFYLNDTFSGMANRVFQYGNGTDTVFSGDWNGDRIDTLMVKRGSTFYARNSNTSGAADSVFRFGDSTDVALTGDWDGDGVDTVAVRRGSTFYLRNSNSTGFADAVFSYGDPTDEVLVGDWNGDRIDTLMVRRGGVFYLRNSNTSGIADSVFGYGVPGDVALSGDWNGDGIDTLALRRGSTEYVRNSNTSGIADVVFAYGNASDTAFAGDWNADQIDTFGVRRATGSRANCSVARCIALTFDDGPSQYTPKLLAALASNGARATFFISGANASGNEAVIQRELAQGNQIGSHGYQHVRLTQLPHDQMVREMQTADSLLKPFLLGPGKSFRPPYGDYNADVRTTAASYGYSLVLWNFDPLDYRTTDPRVIADRVLASARRGSLILSHDTLPATVQAYAEVIPALRARGYELVTVNELLGTGSPGQVRGGYR